VLAVLPPGEPTGPPTGSGRRRFGRPRGGRGPAGSPDPAARTPPTEPAGPAVQTGPAEPAPAPPDPSGEPPPHRPAPVHTVGGPTRVVTAPEPGPVAPAGDWTGHELLAGDGWAAGPGPDLLATGAAFAPLVSGPVPLVTGPALVAGGPEPVAVGRRFQPVPGTPPVGSGGTAADRTGAGGMLMVDGGTPVHAIAAGRVSLGTERRGGLRLRTDDGLDIRYGGLAAGSVAVGDGDRVPAGAVLGAVASAVAGRPAHLVLEVRDAAGEPVDAGGLLLGLPDPIELGHGAAGDLGADPDAVDRALAGAEAGPADRAEP